MPRKEVYTYTAPWLIYGLDFTNRRDHYFRMVIGSFVEDKSNRVQVLQLDEATDSLKVQAETEMMYPASKMMWIPSSVRRELDLYCVG